MQMQRLDGKRMRRDQPARRKVNNSISVSPCQRLSRLTPVPKRLAAAAGDVGP